MSTESSMPGGRPFPLLSELTGTVLDGRYEIGKLLGCGGMGAVYEAMQLRLERRVAIKILNPVYMHRDDYVARFMREAKAASRIRHENVVQVLDFGELPEGSVYSVMEFLEGRDLAQLLQEQHRLPWPRARDLLLQMARGLRAAHAEGVIHRDIKPANLFLIQEPEEDREILKVLDFGIARLQSAANSGLTGTAELLGTPSYMAPELARGRSANPRTEVYSVGVVAYRLITGALPFEGESAFDVLFRSATEPAPPLRVHDPNVPEAIEALVLRMLAKDPEDRFPDMATLYRAIEAVDESGRLSGIVLRGTGPHVPVKPEEDEDEEAEFDDIITVRDQPRGTKKMKAERGSGAMAVLARESSRPIETSPSPSVAPPDASQPGIGGDPRMPQVVVPPPIAISQSTRDAIAAKLAARTTPSASGAFGSAFGEPTPAMRRDPVTPAFDPNTGPVVRPDPPSGPLLSSGEHDFADLTSFGIASRRRTAWIVGGVVGVIAIVSIIVAIATSGTDPKPTPERTAVDTNGQPAAVAPREPMRSDDAAAPSDAAVPAAEPPRDHAVVPTPASDPPVDPPSLDEPVVVDEPPPAKSDPSVEPKPRPKPAGKDPSASEEPLTDGQMKRKLEGQARRKCGKLLGGETLTVTFVIGDTGKPMTPRADRKGEAADCVIDLIVKAVYATGKMRKGEIKL